MAAAAVSKCVSDASVQGFQRKRFQISEMVDVTSFTPRQKGPHISVLLGRWKKLFPSKLEYIYSQERVA